MTIAPLHPSDPCRARSAWLVAHALLAAWMGLMFHGFAFDDPFITYRVARNIAEGQGWVYNYGERINAVTNPLYTLLLAAFYFATRIDLPLLGAAVSMGGLFFAAVFLSRLLDRQAAAGGLSGLLVLSHPLLIGCMGMETGLLLGLCLAALYAYSRERWVAAGALFGLAVLTRMDALVLAGVVLLHYAWTRRKAPPWPALAAFAAVAAPWFIFSAAYFGELVPRTLMVKSSQGQAAGTWGGQWVYARTVWKIAGETVSRPDLTGLLLLGLTAAGVIKALRGPGPWPRIILAWAALHTLAYGLFLRVPAYTWYFAPFNLGLVLALALGGVAVVEAAMNLKKPHAPFAVFAAAGLLIWAIHALSGRLTVPGHWFNPIHGAHALAYLALALAAVVLGLPRLRGRAWLRTAASLMLVTAAFLPRTFNGLLQLSFQPTSQYFYYKAAADWIREHQPGAKTVGAHEIGVLGYYLPGREIIDQCGIPTPGAAEHMARGDMTWWVRAYRPELLVLHTYREWWGGSEGPLVEATWFDRSYRRIAVIPTHDASGRPVVIAGDTAADLSRDSKLTDELEKHSAEVWRLTDPDAIPRP